MFKLYLFIIILQKYIEAGMFKFVYGSDDSLVEFLHVDNLVQAHVLAGQGLSKAKDYIAVRILLVTWLYSSYGFETNSFFLSLQF